MMLLGQRLQDDQRPIGSIVANKQQNYIRCWKLCEDYDGDSKNSTSGQGDEAVEKEWNKAALTSWNVARDREKQGSLLNSVMALCAF